MGSIGAIGFIALSYAAWAAFTARYFDRVKSPLLYSLYPASLYHLPLAHRAIYAGDARPLLASLALTLLLSLTFLKGPSKWKTVFMPLPALILLIVSELGVM